MSASRSTMALISASVIRRARWAARAPGGLVPGLLGFGLGDPRGDRGRARAGVEGGAVLG